MSEQKAIAVIDDDESFRAALVESLLSFGYGARGFASAEEFVDIDPEAWCDCVISDIHMAGMSGFDLKQVLTSRRSRLPVIMITARPEADLAARVAASGAACFLRKPFDPAALQACLKKVLEG